MRYKTELGLFFLIVSAVFLLVSFQPTMTGGIIGVDSKISYFYLFSLGFFIASLIILVTRQTLDAIMIPTGPSYEIDQERTDRAKKGRRKDQIYLITGRIDKPIETSQVYEIYKRLREGYRIKAKNIRIEGKSKNTLENVLFSLKKLKKMKAHDVGIASNPSHLDRFEDLIKQAKKEGIIGKDFRIHRLETSENIKEKLYGIFHRMIYKYELAHCGLKAVGKSKLQPVKRKVTKIINKISK